MRLSLRLWLFLTMVATSVCLVAWLPTYAPRGLSASWGPQQRALDMVDLLGERPILTEYLPMRVEVDCDKDDLNRYASWIIRPEEREDEPAARARILHAARLAKVSEVAPDWLVRDERERVTSVKLAGQGVWHTWRGVEMSENENGRPSEHRDQTLATLADSGVPLGAALSTGNGDFKVRDLLRTSLNEFHLGQGEISWAANAYVAYLPPQTTWRNRFGERITFDLLAEELMRRSLRMESCGGIHMLMALTKIGRVDREVTSILSADVSDRLHGYLRDKSLEAANTQLEDGSWPSCWSPSGLAPREGEFTPEASDIAAVTTAGHLLEWFHLLPEDLRPPARTVTSATAWVRSKLRSTSQEVMATNFCPYTHAIVSLCLATSARRP